MHKLLLLILALVSSLAAQAPSKEEIQRILTQVSEITGFEIKRQVPIEVITREDWKKWLDEEIRRTVKPDEIRADEMALKKFGLVPRDFDLRKATLDLLGEQAAAVYDHRRKKMLLVEGLATGAMQESILVHELSHALADQHLDMKRFLDKSAKSDEAQTARMAVVEGQAMWIMLESQLRKLGQSLTTNRTALDMMLPMIGKLAADSFPVFTNAPLYMRETLMFPYSAGLSFQQAAVEKLGKEGFVAVLRDPPSTTQQVLSPEKYFSRKEVRKTPLESFEGEKEYERLTGGTVGELDFRILFKQYASEKEALEAAPRWRGGTYDLLEHKRDKAIAVLRWSAEWESPEAAGTVLALYRKVLQGKWKKCEIREESGVLLKGEGDDGGFVIRVEGTRVSAVEGLRL